MLSVKIYVVYSVFCFLFGRLNTSNTSVVRKRESVTITVKKKKVHKKDNYTKLIVKMGMWQAQQGFKSGLA